MVLERNWREAQHAWRLLGDGNILNGEEGGQRGVEEGTPEFRSRGEEKGAKKEFQKENTRLRRKRGIRGVSGDQRFARLVRVRLPVC